MLNIKMFLQSVYLLYIKFLIFLKKTDLMSYGINTHIFTNQPVCQGGLEYTDSDPCRRVRLLPQTVSGSEAPLLEYPFTTILTRNDSTCQGPTYEQNCLFWFGFMAYQPLKVILCQIQFIHIICKHGSTKLNGSKYCYASLTIQLNISHSFTHS